MKPRKVKLLKRPGQIPQLGKEILVLAGLLTLIISPSQTIDAFNPPKFALLVLGVFYLGLRYWKMIWQGLSRKKVLLTFLSLLTILFSGLIANTYSISERLFGVAGRNFGFVTLVALILVGLYSFQATTDNLLKASGILNGLAITNFGVVFVFFLQQTGVLFNDFQNEYMVMPSTLGNPNFLSAFIGISLLGVFNWIFQNRTKYILVAIGLAASFSSLYIVIVSQSIQGLIVILMSISLLFLFSSLRFPSKLLRFALVLFFGLVSLIFVSGFLNFGPLGEQLSQRTLGNRLIYWKIAFRIFLDSPLTGKGFDSYLDHYREFITNEDIEVLGKGVISDSPHNIFLDVFVSAGLFSGLFFIVLLFVAIFRIFNCIREDVKFKKYDVSRNSLYSIFLSLLAISFISPFQIGLFVWLPIITGFLLGANSKKVLENLKRSGIFEGAFKNAAAITLGASILVCNPIFAALPFNTEVKFRTAVEESSFTKLDEVALAWPFSGPRAISIAEGFMASTITPSADPLDPEILGQLEFLRMRALEIAWKTVRINERQFEGWRFLLENSRDPGVEDEASQKLNGLDPTNPAWKPSP